MSKFEGDWNEDEAREELRALSSDMGRMQELYDTQLAEIDAIHTSALCPSGTLRCAVCLTGEWPCETHLIIHQEDKP